MTTIADLVSKTRCTLLDDSVSEGLWSDLELTAHAYESINEACIRAPIYNKSSTVAIVSGTSAYDIDPTIRQTYIVKLDLVNIPLIQTTDAELSISRSSTWRLHTGTPTHYLRHGHKITLYPQPLVNDTLVITSSNIPDFAEANPLLLFSLDDVDAIYHKDLTYYIAHKAYLKRDSDAYNKQLSDDYLAKFELIFPQRHSAKYDAMAFETPIYATSQYGRMC